MSVTVVMTAWNPQAAWLNEAVASLRDQAADILIVDDGSTTALGAFTELSQRCDVRHRSHRGIAAASNFGIQCVPDSAFISRLDADDRMMPGTIAALRNYLHAHPDVDVVSGGMRYISPNGRYLGDVQPPPMHASPNHRNRITHSGCMFRRELWERVGGYPDMKYPDWHFWEACEKAGAKFTVLDQLVIERRIHPDSFSFKHSKHLQRWWEKAQRA